MKYQFRSQLAGSIERHLELNRSLGIQRRQAAYTLAAFDRFISEYFPEARSVTRNMIVEFLKTMNHLNGSTQSMQLSHLRQLCRFLFQLDAESYIPGNDLLTRHQHSCRAYVYSVPEVIALMKLARELKPLFPLRCESCETMIGLLWVTGLRISEGLSLNLADVDLEQGLLQINETKFHKSRLVPLSASSARALNSYAELRSLHGHDINPVAPFFVGPGGGRWKYDTFRSVFRGLVLQSGLKTKQGSAPRLHDLRHSFATRCLAGLYRSGKDPNSYLPVLATFLGHACVTYTALYLHPQLDLLEIAGERFKNHICQVGDLGLGGENASF